MKGRGVPMPGRDCLPGLTLDDAILRAWARGLTQREIIALHSLTNKQFAAAMYRARSDGDPRAVYKTLDRVLR